MKTRTKKIFVAALLSLAVTTAVVSTATTLANFIAIAKVGTTLEIASRGEKSATRTIYFNANIWDIDNATFYMTRYNSSTHEKTDVPVSKVIHPTVNTGQPQPVTFTLYAFQYKIDDPDYEGYDKFKFCRVNGSETEGTPSTSYMIKKYYDPNDNEKYDNVSLYDTEDNNIKQARHVYFSVGDRIKGYNIQNTSDITNNAGDSSKGYIVENGFIKIITAGLYTIDLFVEHNEGNHLRLTNEYWNETQGIAFNANETYNYYCINTWDNNLVNRNTLSYDKGLKTWSFNGGDVSTPEAAAYTTVSFHVNYGTSDGWSLYANGAFCDWSLSTDYQLRCTPGNNWIGELELPIGSTFKLIVAETENPHTYSYYEGGSDRTVSANMTVTAWQP